MVSMLILGIFFILFDVCLGLPALYAMYYFHADFIVLVSVGFVMVIAPMMSFLMEMRNRSNYPIRVDVAYQIGEKRYANRNHIQGG